MENASKALIIAGAILLAILLISFGIMIFNQAQDTVNNSGMSQAEMQMFNNKFLKYEGTKKGSEVKALVNEVIASNSDDKNADRQVSIKLETSTINKFISGPKATDEYKNKASSYISTDETYSVTLKYLKDTTLDLSTWKSTIGCVFQILVKE